MIDETLLIACKAKDRSAQRQLYEYMAPKLFYTCKRYMKQEQEAEEILAEAFYIILTKLEQLKEAAAFEGWARRIAVNLCLTALRKKGNLNVYIDDLPQEIQHPVWPSNFEERDLLKLVNQLPDGCRTVFNLYVIEGYNHREIAEQLQISEGTSKSQLNVSKRKLQFLVNQFYYLKEN